MGVPVRTVKESMMKRLICAAAVAALSLPVAAQDKAAEVMQKARATLGGAKLDQLKAVSLEGPFAREMGNRQVQGTMALTLQLPGNMHRTEDTEMMAGMSMERTSVLAGDKAWEDMQNRGGMGGGGMQIVMRPPGSGPGQELNAEQLEQARVRRLRTEFNRYLMAFLGGTGLQPTFVAVAEAPEGKADVLEVKNEAGQAVRIFIDQNSHMPLMLQYQEVRPRVMMNGPGGPGGPGGGFGRAGGGGGGGGGRNQGRGGAAGEPGTPAPPGTAPTPGTAAAPGTPATPATPATPGTPGAAGAPAAGEAQRPNPEEMRRRLESMPPPAPSTINLYLGDYKNVDGIMLPHRLTQAVDGKTVEEWTIEKVKVNPSVKADLFQKK